MEQVATKTDPRRREWGTSSGDVVTIAASSYRSAGPPDALTERSRRVWSAGAYDRIAAGFRDEAEAFVQRHAPGPDQMVLDAACGSGNVTIPAARTGARVRGIDVAPSLLAIAAQRAEEAGVPVTLDEGNVEELPYADGYFDVVFSMFGVMFAARPERVASELTRVTRRGGRVVLANWMRDGFVGRMLAMHAAVVPPPPGTPNPLLWGDDAFLWEHFDARVWRLKTNVRTLTFRYPSTSAGTAELFRGSYGPTVRVFEALDEDSRAEFAVQLTEHWWSHQRASSATTEVEAEYLEVVATRR